MKRCKIFVKTKVTQIQYTCPYCCEVICYNTDGLPPKSQCHKCLKNFKSKYIWEQQVSDLMGGMY